MTPLRVRFWRTLAPAVGGPHECWEWPAATTGPGYGALGLGTREDGVGLAHRVSYELNVGAIPEGGLIHHRCANRVCCNPAHLELTTRREHPDSITTIFAAKTHCPYGHPYDEANTYRDKRGRQCRACRRRRDGNGR